MKSRDQIFLFVLIALIGTGVVVTAWTMPPSRFDPVGTKNIMGVIGILVALFAAICAFLTFNQMRQAGQVESQNPPGMFMTNHENKSRECSHLSLVISKPALLPMHGRWEV